MVTLEATGEAGRKLGNRTELLAGKRLGKVAELRAGGIDPQIGERAFWRVAEVEQHVSRRPVVRPKEAQNRRLPLGSTPHQVDPEADGRAPRRTEREA